MSLIELEPGRAADRIVAVCDEEWVVALTDELDRRLAGRHLERIMRTWGLSRTNLGELFGVSRQAASKWLDDGVPADRVEQAATVSAITDLLTRHLQRDRIPAVVRREAPRLEGRSLLALVTAGEHDRALELTRQMFAFADVHG